MIVKFQNSFRLAGFGRSRFPAGIVTDVPEKLRKVLPKSAKILEDYNEDKDAETREAEEDLAIADLERAQATDEATLAQAGMLGYSDPEVPQEDLFNDQPTRDDWVFEGKAYKTEPAMKAAITRSKS